MLTRHMVATEELSPGPQRRQRRRRRGRTTPLAEAEVKSQSFNAANVSACPPGVRSPAGMVPPLLRGVRGRHLYHFAAGRRGRIAMATTVLFLAYVAHSSMFATQYRAPRYQPASVEAFALKNEVTAAVRDQSQDSLLQGIRDVLAKSSPEKVEALKYGLRGILDEDSWSPVAAASSQSVQGLRGQSTARPVRKRKTESVSSEGRGKTSASAKSGADQKLGPQLPRQEYLEAEGEEGSLREEIGASESEGGVEKAASPLGVDLLWWADPKHKAKTEDELEVEREAELTTKCKTWKAEYKVVPGSSWGELPVEFQTEWLNVNCDEFLVEAKVTTPSSDCKDVQTSDSSELPLVAIMAAATTRGVKNIKLKKLALFRHLLPSVVRTVECGFRYMMVIGHDTGDRFYDTEKGQKLVHSWFEDNVVSRLAEVNIPISLQLVAVKNQVKKPGPVFLEMARGAYAAGAMYYYRVNDDTELLSPWTAQFVKALQTMGPPYGAVGPLCNQGNTKILTHDFTHRTHMEIFDGEYYPPELTDWWMDDWIARTYGSSRTRQSKKIEVIHHTSAHGQRYTVDKSHEGLLTGLVEKGRQKIADYMMRQGVSNGEMSKFHSSRFDKFPLEDIRRRRRR